MDERELVGNILAGNKNAYKIIVEKYQPMVFRVSMGFIHNKEEADDICQEVFVKAYYSLAKFKGNSTFSTWLYRITVNSCLNYLRDNQKRSLFIRFNDKINSYTKKYRPEDLADSQYSDSQLIEEQNTIQVKKAIDGLPPKQKIAFILSKYNDLPQQEIATIMDITEGAVEQLLQRAKVNLRQKLEFYYKKNYT